MVKSVPLTRWFLTVGPTVLFPRLMRR
jgi:hypothetical protein